MSEPRIKLSAFTLDCKDPYELAAFYAKLTGWDIAYHDDDYACLGAPVTPQCGYPGVTFQRNPDYVPPVWPEEQNAQQQMGHIDFAVDDLPQAVAHALSCGARKADKQYSDLWTVMLDPSGHPFCLCLLKDVMNGEGFALR